MTARLPVFLAVACLIAQDPPPIRVSTTLVQVDVVVTDREGRQVTNLTKDDFELFEYGKLRPITHFSYVRTGALQPASNGRLQPVSTPCSRRRSVARSPFSWTICGCPS